LFVTSNLTTLQAEESVAEEASRQESEARTFA
jgi:hypothetical protein